MRPYKEPISEELREKLLVNLSAGVMHMYRYFEPQRKMASQLARQTGTLRREQAKTGRNFPCPCGSGEKYKKCCGDALDESKIKCLSGRNRILNRKRANV